MQSNPVAAIACAVIDHHIHGRAGQRRANRRKNLALDEALVGKHGHPLQAQLGGLRAGFGKNTGAERKCRHANRETAIASFLQGEIGVAAAHGNPLSDNGRSLALLQKVMRAAQYASFKCLMPNELIAQR
ncbi:MAG: hypothetical protein ACR2HE_05090 [Casimicrobiaceae bacterium]